MRTRLWSKILDLANNTREGDDAYGILAVGIVLLGGVGVFEITRALGSILLG